MMKSFSLEYVGNATVDKRLSNPMIPWVIAQIRRGENKKYVSVRVEDGYVSMLEAGKFGQSEKHYLGSISRLAMFTGDLVTMFYAVRHATDSQLLVCHLFQTSDPEQIMEVMSIMKEQSHRIAQSNKQGSSTPPPPLCRAMSATALCPDISPSSSQFFEVLYIGKIKVSHKKVPDSFIDDALDKFMSHEKLRQSGSVIQEVDGENCQGRKESNGLKEPVISEALSQEAAIRKRSGSVGSIVLKKPDNLTTGSINNQAAAYEDNRTMVFYVGRTDLRLISPDRKQVLLHKNIKDVLNCLQGLKHSSHFAFICRESGIEQPHYVGFVFKCQSSSVSGDVVTAITQALGCGKKEILKQNSNNVMSCEHCPLVWFHKLCHDLETISNDISAQVDAVMRRIENLPEDEQVIVETKLQGAALGPADSKERLEILMMLLRAHCESKQSTHVHDTPQNRHEFINNYLGGGTIFMKAKRSLTNSFDQLLKRKGSRDDLGPLLKVLSLPPNPSIAKDDLMNSPVSPCDSSNGIESENRSGPMKNIFMKVGHSPSVNTSCDFSFTPDSINDKNKRPGSWRQAIFNTVVTPSKTKEPDKKRDKHYFRSLWKKAINQQLLLIRMEKENARLTARQEEANVKRIKLEYDDLGCSESNIWDGVISKNFSFIDDRVQLMKALQQGIPKTKRGEVWSILMNKEGSCDEQSVDLEAFPNYNVPYEDLLKQLTSHQHAILIDLGRTFPSHNYFSSPLGPGQLGLFNLLKAYSLLDPEVGYCQGLSFIAAVLLLHMSESESFHVLKQLMFIRGLRKRYLPDMSALQVHLYQLSRLLLDTHPTLYKHLDMYDVSPTLYAAPWLLTFFSSQFPLGFVTRVFDAMIVDSADVLFKVAVSLMGEHKDHLLSCDSFELIMDYFKQDLPCINKDLMDKIMKQALDNDVSKQLYEYGVEYHVLQEEMSSPRPEEKKVKQLEESNQALITQNKVLSEQLQIAQSNVNRLESSRSTHMAQLNKLESQVKNLEATLTLLGEFISSITFGNSDIEIPPEVKHVLTRLCRKGESGNTKTLSKLNLIRSAPLRVIEDNAPSVSTSSTTNLAHKVSGLFRSNSNVSSDQVPENRIGRVLSDSEKEGLLSRVRNNSNNDKQINSSKGFLKASQSSFELSRQAQNIPSLNNDLPLESNGVQVLYEGTTKLKTLHPLRTRNSITSILPADQKKLELKIVEQDDEINDKLKATMDKVSSLFDSNKETLSTQKLSKISSTKESIYIQNSCAKKAELF